MPEDFDFDLNATLRLSRHAALKTRAGRAILVLPERAMRLRGSSAEILRLCEAPHTGREILAAMRARYPDDVQIDEEIAAFLAEMVARGGLESGSQASQREAVTNGKAKRGANSAGPQDSSGSPQSSRPPGPSISAPTPLNLIAELTYRCPLQCPYCSNPLDLAAHRASLSAQDWGRVFDQAAALGVVHVGLTGGEPSTRSDLEEILERAVAADLYSHLVTAGLPLDPERLEGLARLGLRSVQVSIQDATADASDRIAGTKSFERKMAICEKTVELGLALTLNCVLHRENLSSVPALLDLATRLRADRLELANTQYHGWAFHNRAALMPSHEQLALGSRRVREWEEAQAGRGPKTLFVLPDYFSDRPKACMGGWGKLAMVIDPTGRLLPCHEAGEIPGLEFWAVQDQSVEACWSSAPGMQAYRGTAWMPSPCRECPERERDFGGCRCQAFRLLGDAGKTDPACHLSPDHEVIVEAQAEFAQTWQPRRERSDGLAE